MEALQLGHNYIGTEHLLLALFRPPSGPAAVILTELGASEDGVRRRVKERLSGLSS
jgi:ATP-dependent Clp protease ATP-binding subunit ClpA